MITRLVGAGAQPVILGCTEIMMRVGQEDGPVPVFDTTAIHAAAALNQAGATVQGVDDAQRAPE